MCAANTELLSISFSASWPFGIPLLRILRLDLYPNFLIGLFCLLMSNFLSFFFIYFENQPSVGCGVGEDLPIVWAAILSF